MCEMYEYQYLVGGALSFLVSAYILAKRPQTSSMKFLGLFGLVMSVWEVFTYLYRMAPDPITTAKFFLVMILTSHLGFPIYLLTLISVEERRSKRMLLLVMVPAVIQAIMMLQGDYIVSYEFFQTTSGWAYRVSSFAPLLVAAGIVFMGYLLGIVVALLVLIRRTRFHLLRKKYLILLVSFVSFQVAGTTLTNALIAVRLLDPFFPMGGIFQFLTFLSIWYALSLREKEIPLVSRGEDFAQVYSSFLTLFYNSAVGSKLGESLFRFRAFIAESELESLVAFTEDGITLKEAEEHDLAQLIDRNLVFLEDNPVGSNVVDCYLRVLKAADHILGSRFDRVVKANEDFLKVSDLVYGIREGTFLETMTEDRSLDDLNDVEACLRIYKRILLPVMDEIQGRTKEFAAKLSESQIDEVMSISDYGEVLVKKVRSIEEKKQKDQVSFLMERFNSILSWVYGELSVDSDANIEDVLNKLKLVLSLNKERAVAIGVYPSLLGTLSTRVPRSQVHKLYSDYLEELVEERTGELKEAQDSLIKSQRLTAIGEAAAMVGHDLRNPLQAIVNTIYLANKKLASSGNDEVREVLRTIGEQVEYMNKIVSDLQDYARPLNPQLAETSVHDLINNTLAAISVPSNVEVSIEIEHDLDFPKLTVDPSYVKRVLDNLTINAFQAMPEGGRLTIRAYARDSIANIEFRDTGVGISKENLEKMFQPFFTTKAKGQGLGLAVCKRLVEALNGKITVESKVGKGTTFSVKIPLEAKSTTESVVLASPLPS